MSRIVSRCDAVYAYKNNAWCLTAWGNGAHTVYSITQSVKHLQTIVFNINWAIQPLAHTLRNLVDTYITFQFIWLYMI